MTESTAMLIDTSVINRIGSITLNDPKTLPGRNPLVLRKTETGLSRKMITCRLSRLAEKPYMNAPP
jgi:hypothetical protein